MKKRVYGAALFFALLCLWVWCRPQMAYSYEERRALAQFPKLTAETLKNGTFMKEFESYAADQFPMRRLLRCIQAAALTQSDSNGLYETEGYFVDMEYPMQESSLSNAAKIFRRIYEEQLEGRAQKVYFSIIPDKNYFFAKEAGALSIDYQVFTKYMQQQTAYMQYIDIFPLLSKECYYRTDIHWRQETLEPVADKLLQSMGKSQTAQNTVKLASDAFLGVYASQWPFPAKAENLYYLTNACIENLEVYDWETNRSLAVYDKEKLEGLDFYELFLGGSISLLTLENKDAETDAELILFRDSFGSSIAPLLANAYKKITLVDIRYLQSRMLDTWIDFQDADVLFLYSVPVLNHSETLK